MREITIDCTGMSHISQFHETIARELRFPETWGRNYDALHDLLTALTEPVHLILQGLDSTGFPTQVLLQVLTDSQEENPCLLISW